MARLSLAEQLAQIDAPAPVEFDAEDALIGAVDAEGDSAAAREHYVDVGPSALRKLQESVADPKYDGVRKTRKQLMEDSDGPASDMGDEEAEGSFDEGEDEREDWPKVVDEEDEEDNDDDDAPSESESDDEDASNMPPPPPRNTGEKELDTTDDLAATLRKTREEDRKKGGAISRQIAIWDTLLDARIRLQKSVTAVNTLPVPSDLPQYTDTPGYQESLNKMLHEAVLLSDEIFELRENLMKKNEPVSPPPRKRRKIEAEALQNEHDAYLRESTEAASALDHTFHPYLVQTLSKWSSKIQAVAPSVLLPSNRNAFSKSSQNLKSAVQLVDENMADHSKMLWRTQVWRGKGARIGARVPGGEESDELENERDPEVFDDTDFYQQLLRDVIDAQGGKGGDDWMAAQKQRKAKKKVDTKASKGRKLRYEVHEKLQNFMVPVPAVGAWHEEQVDELFASLLGKGFEGALDANDGYGEAGQESLGEALSSGFRVFG